jgi:hypothetical protein
MYVHPAGGLILDPRQTLSTIITSTVSGAVTGSGKKVVGFGGWGGIASAVALTWLMNGN